MGNFFNDLVGGVLLGVKRSGKHILNAYVKVPIGIVIMLAILYGVNEIILQTPIKFPASVTCMLLLYVILVISTLIWGETKVAKFVKIVDIPGGFCLRWINIFFTPAFVTLPLCQWISAKEALTIAAVFVIGYVVSTFIIAYFTIILQFLLNKVRKSNSVEENKEDAVDEVQSIRSLPLDDLERMKSLDDVPLEIIKDLPKGDTNEIEEEYIRRLSIEQDLELPHFIDNELSTLSAHSVDQTQYIDIQYPEKAHIQDFDSSKGASKTDDTDNETLDQGGVFKLSRKMRISNFTKKNFDYFVFGILFVVGIPIFYSPVQYEMPLQLAVAIFAFLFVYRYDFHWKKLKKCMHPVLVSVGISLAFYAALSAIKNENFLDSIIQYKTGRNYLKLFDNNYKEVKPGAGDVFSSLMDVSIVSLSMPMYNYRKDLKRHFFEILPPILLMSAGSFFIYPPLCYHIGISPEFSLGYAGRSITLALGTPFVQALGGNESIMAVTTVVSGVLGALTYEVYFKYVLRVREGDYVTRGITLGLNCGAIASAHLLTVDPRAAAMSSLSFVLFGTIMVILASINPVAHIVRGWVGL